MGRHSSFRALRGAHRVQEGLHLVLKEVEADLVRQQRVVLHGASTAQGLGRSALTCAQPPPAHRSAGRRGQCFAKCPFTCQFDRLSDQFCQSLDRLSDHFAKHCVELLQRAWGLGLRGTHVSAELLRSAWALGFWGTLMGYCSAPPQLLHCVGPGHTTRVSVTEGKQKLWNKTYSHIP